MRRSSWCVFLLYIISLNLIIYALESYSSMLLQYRRLPAQHVVYEVSSVTTNDFHVTRTVAQLILVVNMIR